MFTKTIHKIIHKNELKCPSFWWNILTVFSNIETWLDLSKIMNKIFHSQNNFAHRQFFVLASGSHLFVYYHGEWGRRGWSQRNLFLIISTTTTGTQGIHHDLTTFTACVYLNRSNKWQQFSVFICWPLDHVLSLAPADEFSFIVDSCLNAPVSTAPMHRGLTTVQNA